MAKTTRAQIDKICELADRGLNPGQIAQRLKINVSTINYHMIRQGVGRAPKRQKRLRPYMRAGHEVRPFEPHEDQAILDGRAGGKTWAAIAAPFKRPHNSVMCRYHQLLREQINAET